MLAFTHLHIHTPIIITLQEYMLKHAQPQIMSEDDFSVFAGNFMFLATLGLLINFNFFVN